MGKNRRNIIIGDFMNKFIINKEKIINNYNIFKQIGPVYYPIKANSNKAVIDILSNIFDDKDKFAISNKNIIDSNKTTLINPFYNLEELEYFYNEGVRDFVFEDLDIFIKLSPGSVIKSIYVSFLNVSIFLISVILNPLRRSVFVPNIFAADKQSSK